ncbi:hypothetical protein VM98_29650 [Streptomyces rubellomurinus subsp. indigoferus]|nr:hypothetical protein VM98_29650 [Streptomyces rubellomurinus subsp. indigoferus]
MFDPAVLADPHGFYRGLRAKGRTWHTAIPGAGVDVHALIHFEDVRAGHVDRRLSSNFRPDSPARANEPKPEKPGIFDVVGQHMGNCDPPVQTRLRKLVGQAFSARHVERLRPTVEQRVDELLDAMSGQDEVDLMDAFAWRLALSMICTMLGASAEDEAVFRGWSDSSRGIETERSRIEIATAIAERMQDLLDSRRAEPKDDLLSVLVQAREDDDRLTEQELLSTAFLLLAAGYESVAGLIGSTVLALQNHPEQAALLREKPELLPNAVEEVLRYESPVILNNLRFVAEDMTIGDTEIKKGDLVALSLGSANRDEQRFPNAELFDITRDTSGHLAFGQGIHYCLGAPLARIQAQTAVGRLLQRYPDLKLAADPKDLGWLPTPISRILRTLPVALGPAAR